MRFHGLMLLRDEEDILAQCLEHLLSWIDALYIIDLGSTDASWDIVHDFARRDPRIVPYKRQPIVYTDNLRCVLFNGYRARFAPGDWVMKIDADEFYHVPPPEFVRQRLRAGDTAVYLQWYFFRLTQKEVVAYESGQPTIADDRRRPITDRRRYYKISEYAEPRMFRYRRAMQWPETTSFPFNAGFVARERIPIRHYPHRDPDQMARRYRLRSAMMQFKAHAGGHWKLDDWRQEIVDDAGVAAADTSKVGLSGERGIATGQLHYWPPGQPLAERPLHNHVPPPATRLGQRVIHPLCLPLLDRRRPRFSSSYTPPTIPEDVNEQIGRYVLTGQRPDVLSKV